MNAYQMADEIQGWAHEIGHVFSTKVATMLRHQAIKIEALKRKLKPTIEPQSQDWKGMDGATAFSLIDRHSKTRSDIKLMMEEWLNANNHSAIEISHEKREEIIEKVWSEMKDALCLDHRTFGHQLIEEVLKKRGEK